MAKDWKRVLVMVSDTHQVATASDGTVRIVFGETVNDTATYYSGVQISKQQARKLGKRLLNAVEGKQVRRQAQAKLEPSLHFFKSAAIGN